MLRRFPLAHVFPFTRSTASSSLSQPKHKLLDKLVQSARSPNELSKAVQIIQQWTELSLPPTEVTLIWLDSLIDRAHDLDAVPFSLDVLSDPLTYGLNLPVETPPSIFRKLLYNLLHSTTSFSPPSRLHLNGFMDLANRHAPGDPLILLFALEGYISLWEEGIGRRVWIEQEIRHYRDRWVSIEDGGDSKLALTAREGGWLISTIDNLRPFVTDALLDSWSLLEVPDPGLTFHRSRVHRFLSTYDHLPIHPHSFPLSTSSSTPPSIPTPSTTQDYHTPHRTYLQAHTARAYVPLSNPLLTHYLHLPLQHHPTDPYLILAAIHLYSLDLPASQEQLDGLLARLPEENPWVNGLAEGRELSPVERTRMRSSLDTVGGLLGDKRRFWEAFDPVDVGRVEETGVRGGSEIQSKVVT